MFEPLPSLIRLQRRALGLTTEALSLLAGVSRSRIMALENGSDNISLDLLVKIMNAMEMTELRIGGINVKPATPDFTAMVVAAEALAAAEELMDRACNARNELARVAAPVAEFLAPVIKAPKPQAKTSGDGERATGAGRRTAGRRR